MTFFNISVNNGVSRFYFYMYTRSSDALGTGYDVKSSMSPFGDRRYRIQELRRLRFFISGPNELTEPKFNTHTPKDLYNF